MAVRVVVEAAVEVAACSAAAARATPPCPTRHVCREGPAVHAVAETVVAGLTVADPEAASDRCVRMTQANEKRGYEYEKDETNETV